MKKYEDAVFYYSASIAMFPTVAAFNNRAQSCEYFKHSHCLHLKTVRYWLTAYFWQWAIFLCVCFLGVTGCHIPTGKCHLFWSGIWHAPANSEHNCGSSQTYIIMI